jgi:hypothetical protein
MEGEHILLPIIPISNNRIKQNEQNMSELESKYKLHNKILVLKWIWLYLSQSLTVFDEPRVKFKVIIMVTSICNSRDVEPIATSLNRSFCGPSLFLKTKDLQLDQKRPVHK